MTITIDENVKLVRTSETYSERLFDVINVNRVHLSEFLPWVENIRSADDLGSYLRNCEHLHADGKEVSFIILLNESPVGRIGLHHLNAQNRIGSIGYWLAENAERKGIITRSCMKLIDHGFQQLNLNRIEIKAAVRNRKSQAIPEKLGFQKEGVLREAEFVNNAFTDLFLYSLLKSEWKTAMNDH